ncbi:MAG: phosphodiester glycosidase family protein [Clostridia bacterium]|nr:phosphodiester glycosidase family protein [Clostridia bacterium]MBR6499404.1 phosphodiester glycosidase family protein [Clostridia bacterium]
MSNKTLSPAQQEKEKERKTRSRIRRKWHWGTFRHVLVIFLTFIAAIVAVLVMVLGQFFNGPSESASDMLTQLFHQTSAMKFVPYLYLWENVAPALDRGSVLSVDQVTDTSLVNVAARAPKDYVAPGEEEEVFDENGIRLVEVKGATYHGYMMVVRDPSKVKLGTCAAQFSNEKSGKRVDEIMRDYGAIACMNAGAFSDPNGQGKGGMAEGLVVSGGKIMHHASGSYKYVAGFDNNDILHVGIIKDADVKKLGLRDACAFGPALIVNGKSSVSNDKGLQPRSVIGQRADGAVLLLVVDGRQSNSMGATYEDVINVMLDFGAVNACNMDGGSSTIMYYGDKKINEGMAISVSRPMPTAWIVFK